MFFRDYGFGFLVLGFVILEIYYVRKREDFLAFAWFARNIEIWCVSVEGKCPDYFCIT